MAVCYWEGDTDGDWMTDANWSGVHPAADDEVIFDSRCTSSQTEPTGGMLDSESGHVDHATIDLLHVKKGYSQGLATSSEPCCISPDKLIIEGSGTYHILCGKTDQSTNTTIGTTIINNKDATVYLYSNCNDGANLAEFTNVYLIAGTLYIAFYSADADNQGCSVANLYITPQSKLARNAVVYIEKDAYDVLNSTPMNIYMNEGTLTTDSQVGTFVMRNGTVNYGTDLEASPETDLNITELRQHDGTFNWLPDDSGDDAYISDLWLFGGTFDASSSTNDNRAKALGNGAGNDIHIFTGATLNIANSRGNITIAAGSQLWNFGGTIITDTGSQIAITYDQP